MDDEHLGAGTFPSGVWVSPQGRYVAFGLADGIYLLDTNVRGWSDRSKWRKLQSDYSRMAFSLDNRLAAIVSSAGTVNIYDLASEEILQSFTLSKVPTTIAFSEGNNYLALALDDGRIVLWEIEANAETMTLTGHRQAVTALRFARNGRFLVTASNDSTVRTWVVATGENDHTYEGYPDRQIAVDVTADGRYIISGTSDGTAILWRGVGEISSAPSPMVTEISKRIRIAPNPVIAGNARIVVHLENRSRVRLRIFNAAGEPVMELYNGELRAGDQIFHWNRTEFPSGVYFCRLEVDGDTEEQLLLNY